VLFLDELPEFRRSALEALRQPLEDGRIQIARATYLVTMPARVTVVAAMNPCPCGHHGTSGRTCTCTPGMIERYRARISGPLLDRMDLQLRVQPVRYADLAGVAGAGTASVRPRVLAAREAQGSRLAALGVRTNAEVPAHALDRLCPLEPETHRLLERAVALLGLSARAVGRVRRVARTIADLDGNAGVGAEHVKRALAMREFDRQD
jgi:magnesium chelatase family protein